MDEKLWLALGLRCPSVPAGTGQTPTLLESGCSLPELSIWCYLLSRAGATSCPELVQDGLVRPAPLCAQTGSSPNMFVLCFL